MKVTDPWNESDSNNHVWRDPNFRLKPQFNPLKERYLEFCVNLNIYKGDETDLNMSPEGKRRRRLMEDYEKTNARVPGFGPAQTLEYGKKVEEIRLMEAKRERNKIKLWE